MADKQSRRKFFIQRCGFLPVLAGKLGMGTEKKMRNLYAYYEKLSPAEYEQELKAQLRMLIPNTEHYNIDDPKTFNEKIQWLKVHSTPEEMALKTRLADKYAVRAWIAEKIGEEYLIPLVGGPWRSGEEIDFDALPEQFALKGNHGSGMNLIVKDKSKLDRAAAIKAANEWMGTLYGWFGMETQYFQIPRRIIAEKYIEQGDGNLLDHKIYCFNGEPVYFQMIGNRNFANHDGKLAFYDMDWNLQKFNTGNYPDYDYVLEKPKQFDKLVAIAKILSKGFRYVRVDLYEIGDQIFFGEMTFTPGNGLQPWKPAEENRLMGDKMKLDEPV